MHSSVKLIFIWMAAVLVTACSDREREEQLVDLFATASEDVIALQFPTTLETVVSAGSTTLLTVEGLKSNGVDTVTLGAGVEWSLAPGAISRIDQLGRFSAGVVAETVTVTASLGILSASIEIRVSTALFDQVVALDPAISEFEMCRSTAVRPVGRYVDADGNEEIRSVDSTIIETISWDLLNAEDSLTSQRAYIATENNQPRLHALAAGGLIVRARALSLVQGVEVTSADFAHTVVNELNSIKLCPGGATDLAVCQLSSARVEQDQTISLIAVGTYPSADGSSFNENITRNVKWGTSNALAAVRAFSSDRRLLNVTGAIEETSTSLSAACGTIDQTLVGVDISQGVIVDFPISCGVDPECSAATATISIDRLTVESLDVTANGNDLTDNVALFLDARPAEITLAVTANFVNATSRTITNDGELTYSVLATSGLPAIIEAQIGSPGVFTVLGAGTARIELDYRGEAFIAVIEIPLL